MFLQTHDNTENANASNPLFLKEKDFWPNPDVNFIHKVIPPTKGKETVSVFDSILNDFSTFCELVGSQPNNYQILSRLLPRLIDRDHFKERVSENFHGTDITENFLKLERELDTAFEEMPFEDGVSHPAEVVLEDAFRSVGNSNPSKWFLQMIQDKREPYLTSSILRCLGRLQIGNSEWRTKIVKEALANNDVEVRDAAVQAAESWGNSDVLEVLKKHTENIPWLRSYINGVIKDLTE